jgi:Zn-dependent protease
MFGIPIRLHFTFVLLFAFLLFVGIGAQQSLWADILYIAAIFGSVILHELGHALVARRYGVRTIEIVMFPIGGVARLARNPRPREEFWIAIAGPAVNFVIAAGLLGYLALSGSMGHFSALGIASDHTLPHRIAAGNLILALFNLLPAFPMDGGRILRSLLARSRPEEEATRLAAKAGQVLAILMGLYGLLVGNFFLIFIAFFVYLGAAQEGSMAQGRILTQGMPVRAAMITDFKTLSHGDTIRDAANLLLSTSQQDFPVIHGNEVIGLLGRGALLRGMAEAGPDSFVAAAMNRDPARVAPDTDLADAIAALTPGSCLLVMEGDRLVGLLTAENVSEFLLLRRFGLPAQRQGEVPHAA